MNLHEYMDTLRQQIRCKQARTLVEGEIISHIEDQKAEYEAAGMSAGEAEREAVRQMGDPVQTGMELDRLHRPKIPVAMLMMVIFLTVMGAVMQWIIFLQDGGGGVEFPLRKVLLYNLAGLAVMAAVLFWDYTLIGKYTIAVYIGFLVICVSGSVGLVSFSIRYNLTALFVPVFAGIVYRFRRRGMKGVLESMGLLVLAGTVLIVTGMVSVPGFLQTGFCCLCILTVSILKGWSGGKKAGQMALLWLLPVLTLAAVLLDSLVLGGIFISLPEYQTARLKALLTPKPYESGSGYTMMAARRSVSGFTMAGNRSVPEGTLPGLQNDYIVTSLFSYFGIFMGSLVLLILLSFLLKAFHISLIQKNRAGCLIGFGCGLCMTLRAVSYVAMNFGIGPAMQGHMPFLSYGLSGTLVNAVLTGLILSVFRFTDTAPEPGRWPAESRRTKLMNE